MNWTGIGGQQNVQGSVIVDVGVGCSTRYFRSGEGGPDFRRGFFEFTVPEVAEEVRRLGVAHTLLHAFDLVFDVTIGDQDVGPAIVVVVEEKAAEAKGDEG